jgi:hypothetical protein
MKDNKVFNHYLSIIGWGALFVWWGVCVMIGPITLAMSAMGTGLILLIVCAVRSYKGIIQVGSTLLMGIILLGWGAADQIRLLMKLPGGYSFALALIVVGVSIWITPLLRHTKKVQPE